jgi:hypothetical protein
MQTQIVPESAAPVQSPSSSLTWPDAVRRVGEIAQARCTTDLHGRLQRGTALVLDGAVFPDDEGHGAWVKSTKEGWYYVNGKCTCRDYGQAPAHVCKHRWARACYVRASELLHRGLPPAPVYEDDEHAEHATVRTPTRIPAEHLVEIHGKCYIKYSGLLALATVQGLVRLEAEFISVTPELALAKATATFADGRVFREAADSTPANCAMIVRAHFPRMALVRAKARALRDALNVGECALEELGQRGEEEGDARDSSPTR